MSLNVYRYDKFKADGYGKVCLDGKHKSRAYITCKTHSHFLGLRENVCCRNLKLKKLKLVVGEFQPGGNRDFAKRKITILPIQPLPKDENAAMLRQNRIRKELSRSEEELKQHGGSFAAWREEYRTIAARYQKLCDENYKGWKKAE